MPFKTGVFNYSQGLDLFSCEVFDNLTNAEVAVMQLEYLPANRSNGHLTCQDIVVDRALRPKVSETHVDAQPRLRTSTRLIVSKKSATGCKSCSMI